MLDWGAADPEVDVYAVGASPSDSPRASPGAPPTARRAPRRLGSASAAATLYVIGQRAVPPNVADGDAHLYARIRGGGGSSDFAVWVRANPLAFALGEAVRGPLVASKRRWGEVFIAADGQGIYRGELGPFLRDAAARAGN